jgi:hypothetical protein
MKAIHAFFTGLGCAGVIAYIALICAAIAGYVMNIYKLFAHAPDLAHWGIEQAVRVAGVIPIVGAVVGWF